MEEIAISPETADNVRQIISEVLCIKREVIKDDSRLVEDLGADSLDRLSLLLSLENAFNCSITDEVAAGINTVQDAIQIVSAMRKQS